MIPQRFVIEYPERCLKLLQAMEPFARQEKLVGSFSLLVASALFTIPYERLKARHPLSTGEADSRGRAWRRSIDAPCRTRRAG